MALVVAVLEPLPTNLLERNVRDILAASSYNVSDCVCRCKSSMTTLLRYPPIVESSTTSDYIVSLGPSTYNAKACPNLLFGY